MESIAIDKKDPKEYRFSVGVYVYQDETGYIAYCPSIDLTTTGSTFNEAVANFYEAFQLHMECCIEYGTLWDDLQAHGWRITKSDLIPPKFSVLMKKEEMKRLMNSDKGYEKLIVPTKYRWVAV